jgi:hypothetical protein
VTAIAIPPLTISTEVDPLESHEYGVNTYLYDTAGRPLLPLVYETVRTDWCGQDAPENATGGGYGRRCSRKQHPAHWRHVASNGDTLLCYWGPDAPPPTGGLIDPEDGSDPDSVETVLTAADLNLGHCYKLRDRNNVLYLIGGASDEPRGDGQVEALDLLKREYRLVPTTHILPCEHVLTLDELSWVGSYIHKVRMAVRDEAVEQYLKDRWCMGGLNSSLVDLGLPKYSPLLRGHLTIKIPFTVKETSTGKSEIEAALKPLFEKFLETVEVPDDDSRGLTLRKSAATVHATELVRK